MGQKNLELFVPFVAKPILTSKYFSLLKQGSGGF